MADLKIAVMLSSLRMEPDAGFGKIAEMGVTGVHLGVSEGQYHPDNLSKQDRRELLARLGSLGLEVSALSAWGGEVHLENDDCTAAIADARKYLELAVDLECGIWQSHVGIMPQDENDPGWANHVRHHREIAKHAEEVGACMAIETGPEPPFVLKRLIETVGSDTIRLNWDPANLIMWPAVLAARSGGAYDREQALELYQPVEGLKMVGQYVIHVHAKDGLVHPDGKHQEVAFGAGWVDWDRFISILHHDHDYDGYFAIEREVGENPVADIQTAVDFLKGFRV